MGNITFLSLSLAGTVIGVVIYTGKETRSVLNTSCAKNKVNTFIILLKKHILPHIMQHIFGYLIWLVIGKLSEFATLYYAFR